MTSVVELLCVQ